MNNNPNICVTCVDELVVGANGTCVGKWHIYMVQDLYNVLESLNSSDAGDGIIGANTMLADALAPKVARSSAGMVLAV